MAPSIEHSVCACISRSIVVLANAGSQLQHTRGFMSWLSASGWGPSAHANAQLIILILQGQPWAMMHPNTQLSIKIGHRAALDSENRLLWPVPRGYPPLVFSPMQFLEAVPGPGSWHYLLPHVLGMIPALPCSPVPWHLKLCSAALHVLHDKSCNFWDRA